MSNMNPKRDKYKMDSVVSVSMFVNRMRRRLKRRLLIRPNGPEVALVVEDFSAESQGEISVTRGQQVEVMEASPSSYPEWCMVRSLNAEQGSNSPTEGLVPLWALQNVSNKRHSGTSRHSTEGDESLTASTDPSPHTSSNSLHNHGGVLPSPHIKRRSSSFRKWLTNPVRKIGAQNKSDSPRQPPGAPATPEMSRIKARSEQRLTSEGVFSSWKNRQQSSTEGHITENGGTSIKNGDAVAIPAAVDTISNGDGDEEQDTVEMPPPMEIQETLNFQSSEQTSMEELSNQLASSMSLRGDPEAVSTLDLAARLENIVKNKMESQSSHEDGAEGEASSPPDSASEEEKSSKYLTKRQYVIEELVQTERDYITDLGLVVEGYMEEMKTGPLPEDMQGKDKIVFGNIHQIYDWHKETFCKEIERCLEEPDRLGMLFIRYERRLYMYVKYCENKPKSDYIVAEYCDTYFEDLRQKMGHRLQIQDLLIKPVQRIMKYQLLLKDILKQTGRAGLDTKDLDRAVEVMHVVPKAANDMMNVGRLQGFDGKITAQGKLLSQDTLLVAECDQRGEPAKFKERRVFLFEQIIIFSDMIERKRGNMSNQTYVFKNSIKMNKMSLTEHVESNTLNFMLTDRTPGSEAKYMLQCKDQETKEMWCQKTRSLLDMQGDFLRALQSPIAYQKELTKEMSAPEFMSLTKTSALRKTRSQPTGGKHIRTSSDSKKAEGANSSQDISKRCKSVPGPILMGDCAGNDSKQGLTTPPSPLDKNPLSPTEKLMKNGQKKNSGSPKPRRNIFDGFRSLRKSKTDTSVLKDCASEPASPGELKAHMKGKQASALDISESEFQAFETPAAAKVLTSYTTDKEDEISVHKGDTVHVINTNAQQGMVLVHRPATEGTMAAEGWIPAHIISGDGKKSSWQSKLRKGSFKSEKEEKKEHKKMSKTASLDRRMIGKDKNFKRDLKLCQPEFIYEVPPSFSEHLKDMTVKAGDTAVFTCKVCGRPRPGVVWRSPGQRVISPSPRISISYDEEGYASLQLQQVSPSDSGQYECTANSEAGSVTSIANLQVVDKPGPPGIPIIMRQSGASVTLHWSPPVFDGSEPVEGYTLEFTEQGVDVWQAAVPYIPGNGQTVEELTPGSTYQFRVSAHNSVGISQPGPASEPVRIPQDAESSTKSDQERVEWKTGYTENFTETTELARGRFAVVKRCMDKSSGREVAIKCLSRKTSTKEHVEHEFSLVRSLRHAHLGLVWDLYITDSTFHITSELFPTGRLFDFLCCKTHFEESLAASFVCQLLDVTQYLHNCRVAHLDIKPENLLVDVSSLTPRLKLIDFGDAEYIINNPTSHSLVGSAEFSAPEIIKGTPAGFYSDIWSVGVVIYTMLSGLSPFLDESVEETFSNIIRTDYCFPDEYFSPVSSQAKDLITRMLVSDTSKRPTAQKCMESDWLAQVNSSQGGLSSQANVISTGRLLDFVERRKHQTNAF